MKRRKALSTIALIGGGVFVSAGTFLSSCTTKPEKKGLFSEDDIAFLDEVGETIFPASPSSPGAKAAKIGQFMKVMVTDCYDEKDQKIFVDGIPKINAAAKEKFGKPFMELSASQKHDLLVMLEKNLSSGPQRSEANPDRYFSMMKELTVFGYFTSEPGATRALRYIQTPGHYDGNLPYRKGDKAWAI